jgi:hypothetical protein
MVCFQPPRTHPVEDSERHYVSVHVPLAREMFAARADCRAYHTIKAIRQIGPHGGPGHRLTAWRLTEIWYDWPAPDSDRPAEAYMPPDAVRIADADIPHCIRDMRRFIVTEEQVRAIPSASQAPASYVFEVDAIAERSVAAQALRSALDAVLHGEDAPHRVWVNWVDAENVVAEGVEPGQRHTQQLRESTERLAYVCFLFDGSTQGDRFFATSSNAETLLADASFEGALIAVERTVELDKTADPAFFSGGADDH